MVKEAPMDEHCDAIPWKHNIGRSREVATMESKAISHGMQQTAHNKLGLGVLASNSRHQRTALFGPENVH